VKYHKKPYLANQDGYCIYGTEVWAVEEADFDSNAEPLINIQALAVAIGDKQYSLVIGRAVVPATVPQATTSFRRADASLSS
jgi:hypothetical protein